MEILILATKSIIRVDAKEKTRVELLIHHLSTNGNRLVTQLINENHYHLAISLLDYTLDKYHLLQMTNDSGQIQSYDQKKIEIDLLKHQAICYYRMAQDNSSLSVEKSIHYFFKAFKVCCLIATADNDLKNLKNAIQQCILAHHNKNALLTAYHLAKTSLAEPRHTFMQVPLAIILVKIAMTIGLQCEKAQDYLTIKDKYYETLVAVESIPFSHSETILIKEMKQQLLTYILSYVSCEPTDYAKSIEMAVWGLHYFRSLDLSDTTELTINIGASLGVFLASHLNHFTELSLTENNPEAFIKPIAALIEMPTHDCIEKIILLRALITVCISAGVKHDDQKDFIRAVDYFARAERFWQQMPRETINDTDYLTHSIISRYQAQVHYHQFEMQPTTNNNDEILTKANYLITAARCLDELSEKNITDTDVNNYEVIHTHLEESLMIIEDNIDVLAKQCIKISTQSTQLFFHTSFARVVQSVLKDVIEDKSYIRLNAACIIIKDYMQKMSALRDNICFQRCERYLLNCLEICRYLLKDRALLVASQHSQQNNGLSLSQFSR